MAFNVSGLGRLVLTVDEGEVGIDTEPAPEARELVEEGAAAEFEALDMGILLRVRSLRGREGSGTGYDLAIILGEAVREWNRRITEDDEILRTEAEGETFLTRSPQLPLTELSMVVFL